ncbi:hypothetical protein [Brevibacterium aurantiacum]|uniref:hypothetical protein n=1 Tax=Brevibacterium aurantiacum TaxID=273384 RepID=UPI001D027308|nr:hypothetical protein [Brevibacterium aurantiacum]
MTTKSYTQAVADGIWGAGADLIGYIPSVTIAPVIEHLVTADGGTAGRAERVKPLSREEEAIGVLGALPLAGKFGAIVMQDNGFGNSLTALTTFSLSYHLPLLIFANTRGGPGGVQLDDSFDQPADACDSAHCGTSGSRARSSFIVRGLGADRRRGGCSRSYDLSSRRCPRLLLEHRWEGGLR